jgi:xanthosine utilization system XapX-like protein
MRRNPANVVLLAVAVVALVGMVGIALGPRLLSYYPAPVVQQFMDQCLAADLDRDTCTCIVEDMQEEYRLDQAIRIGLSMQDTGEVPPELLSAAAWCLDDFEELMQVTTPARGSAGTLPAGRHPC